MIGDDQSDIPAMQACVAAVSASPSPASFPAAQADFVGPDAVRAWLMELLALLSIREGETHDDPSVAGCRRDRQKSRFGGSGLRVETVFTTGQTVVIPPSKI